MNGDAATLTWSYQGNASFEVETEDTDLPGTNFTAIDDTSGRSATFSLNPGDHFKIRIRADRSDGTVSDYQGVSADAPPVDPSTPPDSFQSVETPALSLQVGQPVDGNPTVTWTLPEGVTSGLVTFYYLARQNGQSVPVRLTYQTIDINLGTWTFGGIPDGADTIFAIYSVAHTGTDGSWISGVSPESNDVEATQFPAGPWTVSGVLDPQDADEIDLHWENTPNDEAHYKILRSVGDGGFEPVGETGTDQTEFTDQLPGDFSPGEPLSYEVEATNMAGTSGPATTQPSTQPTIYARVVNNSSLYQIVYKGPGKPQFFQTVQISGNPIPPALEQYETSDPANGHGGQDPFKGPVPDNLAGNPNQPYDVVMHVGPGEYVMSDSPKFPMPPYPADFQGQKSFVTTVKNANGQVLAIFHWHTTRSKDGTVKSYKDD